MPETTHRSYKRPPAQAFLAVALALLPVVTISAPPSDKAPRQPVRGSIVEDRAARKLLEAGDVRYDAREIDKAVEIWESVIERYPRSKVRFSAHLKLGEFYLHHENAYDRARNVTDPRQRRRRWRSLLRDVSKRVNGQYLPLLEERVRGATEQPRAGERASLVVTGVAGRPSPNLSRLDPKRGTR